MGDINPYTFTTPSTQISLELADCFYCLKLLGDRSFCSKRAYNMCREIMKIKVFVKRKILSIKTILSAYARTPPSSDPLSTREHSDCTQLNLHSLKLAANETLDGPLISWRIFMLYRKISLTSCVSLLLTQTGSNDELPAA